MIEILALPVYILCVMCHQHKIGIPILTLLEVFATTDIVRSL